MPETKVQVIKLCRAAGPNPVPGSIQKNLILVTRQANFTDRRIGETTGCLRTFDYPAILGFIKPELVSELLLACLLSLVGNRESARAADDKIPLVEGAIVKLSPLARPGSSLNQTMQSSIA